MYIDGRCQPEATYLSGDISALTVDLKCAGIGIDLQDDIGQPRLWLAGAHSHAQYDDASGALEVVEHFASYGRYSRGSQGPLMWLNLPSRYAKRIIGDVDVAAPGSVYIDGLSAGCLTVCTNGLPVRKANGETMQGARLRGVHIGERCLCKTIEHDVIVEDVVGPEGSDPQFAPGIDLASLKGCVMVSGSKASWRVYGPRGITFSGSQGATYPPSCAPR